MDFSKIRLPQLSTITAHSKRPAALIAAGSLVGYFALKSLNATLSRRAANNNTVDRTWNWDRELVVVTGGSSGIGAAIVAKFVARNIKVIILDLNPPQYQRKLAVLSADSNADNGW
jgi:all-trans-retinol dehydrogenase (NAD+)